MGIFHKHAIGFVLAAGALLIANNSDAAMPVAPLKSATTINKVAQGCGPGGFRDPYGHCRYGHGYGYDRGYGYGHGHGYGSNGCPPGWTVQGGNCAPYKGPRGPGVPPGAR